MEGMVEDAEGSMMEDEESERVWLLQQCAPDKACCCVVVLRSTASLTAASERVCQCTDLFVCVSSARSRLSFVCGVMRNE